MSEQEERIKALEEKVRNQRREINLITQHMTNEWGVLLDDPVLVAAYDSEEEAALGQEAHGGEVVHRFVTAWEPRDMVLRQCPGCLVRARDLRDPRAHKLDCSWWNPRRTERGEPGRKR